MSDTTLDVRTLRPRDLILTIPTPCSVCGNDPMRRKSCEPCRREGLVPVDYEIKGTLPVTSMLALLDVNDEIQEANDERSLLEGLRNANRVVNEIIQHNNPSAPTFEFTLDEIIGPDATGGILGFLARNRSVSAEVDAALAAGMPTPGSPEAALIETAAAAGAIGLDEQPEGGAPLPSPSGSSDPSSISGNATAGGQNGGETSHGEPSAATSTPRTEP